MKELRLSVDKGKGKGREGSKVRFPPFTPWILYLKNVSKRMYLYKLGFIAIIMFFLK